MFLYYVLPACLSVLTTRALLSGGGVSQAPLDGCAKQRMITVMLQLHPSCGALVYIMSLAHSHVVNTSALTLHALMSKGSALLWFKK